ncbi:hypothetical protein [Variovorax sp. W2I14]|uniref:hypothetical protein n=1 Tax=Variovorax sp. W2I14 TaxID=3042290 RepID=UPI003D1D9C44
MTLADYAKHRACSPAAVTKAAQAGRISLIDGKIDPMIADAQWKANTRARMPARAARDDAGLPAEGAVGGSEVAPESEGYWNSRGRREAAEAEMAELKLAEQRKELIRVLAVETVWAGLLAAAREHLLQIRARLAPLLAAESDVFKIEQMLDAEHNQALQMLSAADVRSEGDSA